MIKQSKFNLNVPIYVWGIVLYLASFLVTGYGIYVDNHSLQIPLVHFINDSRLYANDPFAQTLPYYASAVWHLVALGNRIFPLEPLLLALFLLERLLVIVAAGYLAKSFAPQSKLAIVGAMALFALGLSGPTLGVNTLVTDNFEQSGLSIPFFLLAFAAFHQRNAWLVAVWTAIGFNCNSMYGVYALTYLGAAFILDSSYRQELKQWLLAFGLFLVLSLPSIMLTISAFGREAADKELWYSVSKFRFPYHLFPLTWNPIEFAKYAVLIFLVNTFLWQQRAQFSQLFRQCSIWTVVSLLWLIYAFVAAYITKSPSMLVMHPGRGITLWYGVAGIALVSACAVKLESTKGMNSRAFRLAVFAASLLIWYPLIGPYILTILMMILAVRPIWYYLLNQGNPQRIALLLTLWVVLVGVTNLQSRRAQNQSLEAALFYRPSVAIEEIANWARDKTPIDSTFLVSFGLDWQQFRSQSQRPVLTNWKDGSAILWDRTFVIPWVERLNAIGLDITEPGLTLGKAMAKLTKIYQQLQDEDVERLKSRFQLSYWVVAVDRRSKFPVVFQNQSFKVLKLEN